MTPPDTAALSIADLADARRILHEDVQRHRASVNFFASDLGFHRTAEQVSNGSEVPAIRTLTPGEPLSGVTTSATCFESLEAALLDEESSDPRSFSGLAAHDRERLDAFASNVIGRTAEWRSEGAARRYCIVRASAPLMRLCAIDGADSLTNAVKWVWAHVRPEAGKEAIFEVARDRDEREDADPWAIDDDDRRRYPPNAFLTHWGLAAARELVAVREPYEGALHQSKLWLRQVIGRECAYVYAHDPARDPQQLAWAITGVVSQDSETLADRADETKALVRAGLRAFFDQQLADGTWEIGRALFHYPEAGNAYCYSYETLAELVALAIDPQQPYHDEMRQLLRPYLAHLLNARASLSTTARRLGMDEGVGWSSGHHPHRTSPESWATATAYRFLQNLRRLVGIEVRDLVAQRLQARRPRKSLSDMARIGSTWDAGNGSAGDLLAALFVHPTTAFAAQRAIHDPDRPKLSRSWARSAILYGPPGTGKTTLAEAVAGGLNWDFVEITPAHFLDRGMEMVSARADEIFQLLMQLDRAVVLFDEIDELVRRRDEGGLPQVQPADRVGRFFTTTMLPRLARLWSGRRVIFFANTNALKSVDAAVRRSQRFDATILVMSPSLRARSEILGALVEYVDSSVIKSLLADEDFDTGAGSDRRNGWYPFLRYDQLHQLRDMAPPNADDFLSRVEELGEEASTDWVIPDRGDGAGDDLMKKLIRAYRDEASLQHIDPARFRVVQVPIDAPASQMLLESGVLTAEDMPEGYARWLGDGSLGDVMDGAGRLRE